MNKIERITHPECEDCTENGKLLNDRCEGCGYNIMMDTEKPSLKIVKQRIPEAMELCYVRPKNLYLSAPIKVIIADQKTSKDTLFSFMTSKGHLFKDILISDYDFQKPYEKLSDTFDKV